VIIDPVSIFGDDILWFFSHGIDQLKPYPIRAARQRGIDGKQKGLFDNLARLPTTPGRLACLETAVRSAKNLAGLIQQLQPDEIFPIQRWQNLPIERHSQIVTRLYFPAAVFVTN
jgi:hypothetical protein